MSNKFSIGSNLKSVKSVTLLILIQESISFIATLKDKVVSFCSNIVFNDPLVYLVIRKYVLYFPYIAVSGQRG